DGIEGILATMITDSVEALEKKLMNWNRLIDEHSEIAEVVAGFHVEGPFISPKEGYVGAHPVEHVQPARVEDAERLVEAGRGRIRLLTLAPEQDKGAETIRYLRTAGVTVSAGHCDPSLEDLNKAIESGLTMVTHLGNGCPVTLPRHDNIIQKCLHLSDHLWNCFIPDGFHVPFFALQNYFDQIGRDKVIVTTDAIMAAGLGPGKYELSGFPVEIDATGVARRPGSENLAGSTIRGFEVAENLRSQCNWSEAEILKSYSENPRSALGLL
ncbi:MAG: N-acetylglucosamine-6-phosphate deacetylase, partial [Verrucomicrobiota bacterium]